MKSQLHALFLFVLLLVFTSAKLGCWAATLVNDVNGTTSTIGLPVHSDTFDGCVSLDGRLVFLATGAAYSYDNVLKVFMIQSDTLEQITFVDLELVDWSDEVFLFAMDSKTVWAINVPSSEGAMVFVLEFTSTSLSLVDKFEVCLLFAGCQPTPPTLQMTSVLVNYGITFDRPNNRLIFFSFDSTVDNTTVYQMDVSSRLVDVLAPNIVSGFYPELGYPCGNNELIVPMYNYKDIIPPTWLIVHMDLGSGEVVIKYTSDRVLPSIGIMDYDNCLGYWTELAGDNLAVQTFDFSAWQGTSPFIMKGLTYKSFGLYTAETTTNAFLLGDYEGTGIGNLLWNNNSAEQGAPTVVSTMGKIVAGTLNGNDFVIVPLPIYSDPSTVDHLALQHFTLQN